MTPNVNTDDVRSYENMKFNAEMKKSRVESSPEFQKKLDEHLGKSHIEEFMSKLDNGSFRKASNEITKEGLIKIMLAECQFTGIDQDNKSNPADMMISITTLDSAETVKSSITEFKLSNQLLTAANLEGKDVEIYQPTNPRLEAYYKQNPEERPKITGRVVNYFKEDNKVYLNLNTNPNGPKGSEKIIKIEIENYKNPLPNPNIEAKKFAQDYLQTDQLNKALQGKTVEAFAPLDEEMLKLKEYIDIEYRPTIKGEVIDAIKEGTGYFVNIKQGEETVKVNFNDIISP